MAAAAASGCACREHLEDVLAVVIPSEDWDEDPTFEELLATGSLGVRPIDPKERFMPFFDEDHNESRLGPLQPTLCESGLLAAIARGV